MYGPAIIAMSEWQPSLLQKVRQLKSENKFIFLNHDSEQMKNSWCYFNKIHVY